LRRLESKQRLIQIGSHPDIDALDAPQVEKQDGSDLVLTTNLHFPSTYFTIYLNWTIVEPG